MDTTYVHGYTEPESRRLGDQADTLAELLHAGTAYPAGSRVLEVGCGVGAQTVHLVARSPDAHLTAVDVSAESLAQAKREWARASSSARPTCSPSTAVGPPLRLLRARTPAGAGESVRPLEDPAAAGRDDHRHRGRPRLGVLPPTHEHAQAAIDCLVRLQTEAGGDGLLGRRLYPLLADAGFADVEVEPRTVYADASRPDLVTGFTRDTFTAMVEGVGETAVASGLIAEAGWARGVADLHRTTTGTFHYTFFKATGGAS